MVSIKKRVIEMEQDGCLKLDIARATNTASIINSLIDRINAVSSDQISHITEEDLRESMTESPESEVLKEEL